MASIHLNTWFPWMDTAAVERIEIYLNLLRRWNRAFNLTGIPEDEWMDRLVAESLMLVELIPEDIPQESENQVWMDMGTGAGIPGLIVAASKPAHTMVLVDSRQKKMDFVWQAVHEMQLTRVKPVCERLEVLANAPGSFQGCTNVFFSRALAGPDTLVSFAAPLSARRSVIISPISGRKQKKHVNFKALHHSIRSGRIVFRSVPGSGRRIQCMILNMEKKHDRNRS